MAQHHPPKLLSRRSGTLRYGRYNAGSVKEARNALQEAQLFPEFSDPQQHPDGEFRIVRVLDNRRWYIYYKDKVFQIDRVPLTNWWEWYLADEAHRA